MRVPSSLHVSSRLAVATSFVFIAGRELHASNIRLPWRNRRACRGDRHILRHCRSGVAGRNVTIDHRAEGSPESASAHAPMKHLEFKHRAKTSASSGLRAPLLRRRGRCASQYRSAARRKSVFSRELLCNKDSPGWSYFAFAAANRRPTAVASDNRPISPISGIELPVVGKVAGSCA
jgi:hypothetical protein